MPCVIKRRNFPSAPGWVREMRLLSSETVSVEGLTSNKCSLESSVLTRREMRPSSLSIFLGAGVVVVVVLWVWFVASPRPPPVVVVGEEEEEEGAAGAAAWDCDGRGSGGSAGGRGGGVERDDAGGGGGGVLRLLVRDVLLLLLLLLLLPLLATPPSKRPIVSLGSDPSRPSLPGVRGLLVLLFPLGLRGSVASAMLEGRVGVARWSGGVVQGHVCKWAG